MEGVTAAVCFLLLALVRVESVNVRNTRNRGATVNVDGSLAKRSSRIFDESSTEDAAEQSSEKLLERFSVMADDHVSRDFRKSMDRDGMFHADTLKRQARRRPRGDYRALADVAARSDERPRGGRRELVGIGLFPHGGKRNLDNGRDITEDKEEEYYFVSGLPQDALDMPHAGKREYIDANYALRPRGGR